MLYGFNVKCINSYTRSQHNLHVIQQDKQCFMIEFIHNIWWLEMFRTSIIHLQERFQAVCCKFGMWYFAYYSIRPDVMRLYEEHSPKYVKPPSVMSKLNHKSLCILLDYMYIARCYTVRTISTHRNLSYCFVSLIMTSSL